MLPGFPLDIPSIEATQRGIRRDPDAGPAAGYEPRHGAVDDTGVSGRRVASSSRNALSSEDVHRRFASVAGICFCWHLADRD